MALGNNPANPGLAGGGARGLATNYDLFLKVFSGEILTAFNETNVAKDLIMTRTISSGKSAQFPVTGKADAKYHTPGADLLSGGYLSQIEHQEKVINIDDMLVASTMIPRIDELKNHFDLRSIYSSELGKALAKRLDIQILKVLFAAASTTAENVTGSGTGTTLSGVDTSTVSGIVGALYDAAAALDNNEVPDEGRFGILTPEQYYKLLTADHTAINKDFSNGSNADAAKGRIIEVAGIKLYKSPHLAGVQVLDTAQNLDDDNTLNDPFGTGEGYNTDLSGYTGAVDSTKKGFLVGHSSAVGCVKLLDLATESEYLIERQSTLFVAKFAMGLGVLRPESAVAVDAA